MGHGLRDTSLKVLTVPLGPAVQRHEATVCNRVQGYDPRCGL